MWLLAELADQIPDDLPWHFGSAPWTWVLLEVIYGLFAIPYLVCWVWLLFHCYRTEPDRQFWIWVMIIAQPIGPIAYFVLRFLPSKQIRAPSFLRRWTRGAELARLETAAHQIGNSHQFVLWGDALREVGSLDLAANAYQKALNKEANNRQALWGLAIISEKKRDFEDARKFTRQILDQDPHYKFGDVSLAHGRALNHLGHVGQARSHFEQHARRWRHPEALYLLATICFAQGDTESAREHLQGLIYDINGSPSAIARKNGRWKSRARLLLRKSCRP